MIELGKGNLLKADVEALVNTVNCVGVMGKGIALQFKQAYPENFKAYEKACRAGEVRPGKMFIVPTNIMQNPKFIVNFPTKRHWKGNSKIEDIKSGLTALIQDVQDLGITSIAIPPLGCGLGGLRWSEVKPLIEEAFSSVPSVKVLMYEPAGAPVPPGAPPTAIEPSAPSPTVAPDPAVDPPIAVALDEAPTLAPVPLTAPPIAIDPSPPLATVASTPLSDPPTAVAPTASALVSFPNAELLVPVACAPDPTADAPDIVASLFCPIATVEAAEALELVPKAELAIPVA